MFRFPALLSYDAVLMTIAGTYSPMLSLVVV